MKKCNSVFIVFTLLLVVSTLSIYIGMGAPYAYGSAVIWTDKPNYAPWETVTIFGSGFNPNINIVLTITRPDLAVDPRSTISDASGNFVYYYVLDGMFGTYTVTATDGTNSATTTFTEAAVDFRQYATKDDKWINSILQSSNSIYYECMSVPQRLIFVDVASTSGNAHTLTLSHEATKGGIHAYDWLTGWNQGNVPPLGYTPWGENIGPPATLAAICQALHLKTAPYEIYVDVPNDPFISKDGSTQARINAYEAAWGNRQIRICGNQPITSAGFSAMSHDVANGGDTGDSFILYTLTWTSASDQILIELSGHLALSGDPAVNPIAWGVGLGSSQVAGGPYHFKLDKLDGGSLGSQDNQIKGADILIPPGHIIVHKTTVPVGDPAAFTFDPDYQVSNFVLSDGEQYDSGAVVPGTYHVQELALAGWDLTAMSITDPSGGSSYVLGTGTATIGLAAGETVHVYYTNTKRGKIIVDKITVPSGSSQSFTFTPSYGSAFGLTDAGTPVDSGWLVPGTYSVTETVPVGWDLTSVTVNGATSSNGASLTVGSGQILYVNFTNTQRGKIVVDKITVPSGSSESFDFTTDAGAPFSLTDAAVPWDSGWILPSTYYVSETVPVGWDLTSAVASDGSPVSALSLQAGETITVTFTDTQRGYIIVHKTTVPVGDPADFTFDPDYQVSNFVLSDGEQYDSGAVVPGTYHVQELALAGWDLTGLTVTDPSGGSSADLGTRTATIGLAAGETVHVYYTNTIKPPPGTGNIIVEKITLGGVDTFDFVGADTTLPPGFSSFSITTVTPGVAASTGFTNVNPGTYTVTEQALTGWDLTGITINDPDGGSSYTGSTATLDVDSGETLTVTFTDTKRGKIIVDKITVPAADPQSFDFSLTGGPDAISQSFSLTDAATPHDSGAVKPGTYAAAETVPTGWDLTSAVCSDGSPVNAISLQAGETVTVAFTDTERGKIVVDKVAVPSGDPQSFDFSVTGPNSYSDSFSLTDAGAPHDSGWIKPGTYAASETVPTGWDLTSAICSDGSSVNAIVLDPGETVTVTFTDTKRVPPTKCTISDFVWKDLDHDGIQDVGEPGFPGVTVKLYDSLGNLVATTTTSGNGLYSFTVDPGSYYLEFVPPSGYVLTLQDQGPDDAKDSDPNPTTHKTATFTVTSGQTDSTRDTGMYATAPPPPVGGVWVSTDKLRLLTPWIGSACLTMAILASFVCFKRKKKRMG